LSATSVIAVPIAMQERIQAMPVGIVDWNVGISIVPGGKKGPTAVAETVIIAPAKKQNNRPLARL
jgi:hypothetical protein